MKKKKVKRFKKPKKINRDNKENLQLKRRSSAQTIQHGFGNKKLNFSLKKAEEKSYYIGSIAQRALTTKNVQLGNKKKCFKRLKEGQEGVLVEKQRKWHQNVIKKAKKKNKMRRYKFFQQVGKTTRYQPKENIYKNNSGNLKKFLHKVKTDRAERSKSKPRVEKVEDNQYFTDYLAKNVKAQEKKRKKKKKKRPRKKILLDLQKVLKEQRPDTAHSSFQTPQQRYTAQSSHSNNQVPVLRRQPHYMKEIVRAIKRTHPLTARNSLRKPQCQSGFRTPRPKKQVREQMQREKITPNHVYGIKRNSYLLAQIKKQPAKRGRQMEVSSRQKLQCSLPPKLMHPDLTEIQARRHRISAQKPDQRYRSYSPNHWKSPIQRKQQLQYKLIQNILDFDDIG